MQRWPVASFHNPQDLQLSVSSVGSEAMQHWSEGDYTFKPKMLSVSSVGSEAMQPLLVSVVYAWFIRLSVSSVGSEAMQRFDSFRLARTTRAFSILGRIGGDATMLFLLVPPILILFQYPRSDRRRCNAMAVRAQDRPLFLLSVSSVGSEAMQRLSRRSPCGLPSLSVSSVGSEAMQRGEEGCIQVCGRDFQYPRSDRRRCNPTLNC